MATLAREAVVLAAHVCGAILLLASPILVTGLAQDRGDAVFGVSPPAISTAPAPPSVAGAVDIASADAAAGKDNDGFAYSHGRELLAATYGELPDVGETRLQAGTGAGIRRAAAGGLVVYSRFSPTSIDNRWLVVHGEDSHSARIVDRASGALVRDLPDIGEENEIRWHYGRDAPSRIYYVRGMQFRQRDIASGADALVRDFTREWPSGSQLFTDVEGDSSSDSRYWCWMVRREVETGPYPVELLISYDRQSDTVVTADAARLGRTGMGRPNTIEASPGGTACVVHWGTAEGRPQAWRRDFSGKIRDVAVDETHTGWIVDASGDEWFVSQNNQTDWIEAVNLQSGETRRLLYHGDIGWNTGMHFSRDYARTGHVLLSTCSDGNVAWGENQLIMLGIDGQVLRIAHTHNSYPGDDAYRNEAAAAVSHDGRSIYWTSNWGAGTRTRDVYAIDLPDNWWRQGSEVD